MKTQNLQKGTSATSEPRTGSRPRAIALPSGRGLDPLFELPLASPPGVNSRGRSRSRRAFRAPSRASPPCTSTQEPGQERTRHVTVGGRGHGTVMYPRGWSNDKYIRFENIFLGGLTFPSNLFGLVPELRVSTCARTPEQALYHEVGGGCAHEKRRIPSVLGVRQTVLGVIRVMSARAGVSPVNARRDNSFEIREQ